MSTLPPSLTPTCMLSEGDTHPTIFFIGVLNAMEMSTAVLCKGKCLLLTVRRGTGDATGSRWCDARRVLQCGCSTEVETGLLIHLSSF